MGINGLWDVIGAGGVDTSLAEWSAEHFAKHGRPLRIAIDEAHWRYKSITAEKAKQLVRDYPGCRPRELYILERIWPLTRLNIQLIFVFDGDGRPRVKRGKKTESGSENEENNDFFKLVLSNILIPWQQAPGEAEAECAAMQRLGLVDAVWSEDSDTLLFGCDVLIRNMLNSNGEKCKENARVYRMNEIERATGISRDGIVLFAMLVGCDYTKGLSGCGTVMGRVLASKPKLVKEFSEIRGGEADAARWRLWRRRLGAQLETLDPRLLARYDKNTSNIGSFPDLRALAHCRDPVVSSEESLRQLPYFRGQWYGSFTTESLQTVIPFLTDRFWYRRPSKWWLTHLAPIALNQRLLAAQPGARNSIKEIKQKKKPRPTSAVEIDPNLVFPGIEAGMFVGMSVLKEADLKVLGQPIGVIKTEMLDVILGFGMAEEEFTEWRKRNGKGRERKSQAQTDMPTTPQTMIRPQKRSIGSPPFQEAASTEPLKKRKTHALPESSHLPSPQLSTGNGPQLHSFSPLESPKNLASAECQYTRDQFLIRRQTPDVEMHAQGRTSTQNTGQKQVESVDALAESDARRRVREYYSTGIFNRDALAPLDGNAAPAKQAWANGKGQSVENPIMLDD